MRASQRQRNKDRQPSSAQSAGASQTQPNPPAFIPPNYAEQPKGQENCCQQRKRDWLDYLGFGVSVGTLIFVGWYTTLTGTLTSNSNDQTQAATRAAKAAETAAKATADQLAEMKADRRPWLSLDSTIKITQQLKFDDDGASVGIEGTIRNGGKSVAKNVFIFAGALMVQPLIPEGVGVGSLGFRFLLSRGIMGGPNGCNPSIAREFTSMGGVLLLPGGEMPWLPTLKAAKKEFALDSRGRTGVWMDLCVFYRDDRDEVHATPLILSYVDEKGAGILPVGQVNGSFKVFSSGGEAY